MRAKYKHIIHDILNGGINSFHQYTAFDYNHGDIVMGNIDPAYVKGDFGDFCDEEEDPETYSLLMKYIDETFTNDQWYDKKVLSGINEVIIHNKSRFNEDSTLYQDNCKIEFDIYKRINVCSPNDISLIKYGGMIDKGFCQKIYSIDKSCFYPQIIIAKGSKNNWCGEVLINTYVNIKSHRLTIECTFDS